MIIIHHLFSNKFSLPCSGPLTSDPAIGWLDVQNIVFFKFFLIIAADSNFDDPTSVIICLGFKYLLIFKIIFLYSLIGVQKIIKSDFITASSSFLTITQGNLSFFIFVIFFFNFSKTKTFLAIFFFIIFLNKDDPKSPQPIINTFFIV